MSHTFILSYACNTDDRHYEDSSCYRPIAKCHVATWNDAFNNFRRRYPALMEVFGHGARVAIIQNDGKVKYMAH